MNHHLQRLIRTLLIVAMAWLFLASAPVANAQRGAITLPRNLNDLTAIADRIVEGQVVTAVVEPHPTYQNLKTVVVTIQVSDVLKGTAGRTLSFRQFIWDIRDVVSTAGYSRGEHVLLFLNAPTPAGLVTPVGLEQGRFRVSQDRNGEVMAVNGNGNAGLLEATPTAAAPSTEKLSAQSRAVMQNFRRGRIPLSALKESTRMILRGQVGAK